MTLRLRHRFTAFAVSLAVAIPTVVRAEDAGAKPAGGGSTIEVGAIYEAPAPIEPNNEDRSNNNGAAIAAAAIGAAVAGISCIMLMKQAMQEEDPEKRQQLLMQALQQCGQAAQQALSAAQNEDQKKKLQAAPEAPQTTIATKPYLRAEKESETPTIATLGDVPIDGAPQDLTSDLELPGTLPDGSPLGGSDLGGGGGGNFDFSPPAGAPAPPAAARLGFNEDAQTGGTTGGTGGGVGSIMMGSMGGGGIGTKASFPEGGKLVPAGPSLAPKEGGRSGDRGIAGDSGSGGSGDDSGSSSLESMMAGLFGGQKESMDSYPIGSGADILSLKGKSKDGKEPAGPPPNIFEYASYRYKKAAYQDGKVRARATVRRSAEAKSIGASPAVASTSH